MKNLVSVQLLTSLLFGLNATATTLTWNGPAGGDWDSTTQNWLDSATPAIWSSINPDSAVFGATGSGAVNLTEGITAGGMTFDAPGYTIAGNTLTLSGTPSIITNANALVSSTIAGSGLTKAGSATLTLSGTNSGLSGDVTVSAGTLQLDNASAAGTGTVVLGDGSTGSATTQLTLGNSATNIGFTRNITVSSSGTGTATIKFADIGTNTSGTGTITLNRAATIDGLSITNGYQVFNRNFAGAGALTYAGAAAKRFILISSSATFTGDVIVQSGILEPRNTLNTTTGSNMSVASGAELRTDSNLTVNALNGAGIVQGVNFGGSTLTVGKGDGSGTFSGTIRNNPQAVSLTKTGNGTQILSGTNTYTGATTVNGGILQVDGSLGSSSAVGVNTGGKLSGAGTVNGNVTINSGGTLAAGGTTIGSLKLAGTLSVNAASSTNLRISKAGATLNADQIKMTGASGIAYNGTLNVALEPGSDILAAGDKFFLFTKNAGTFTGSFSSLNLPDLGSPSLQWDTSSLIADGSIQVQAVGTVSSPVFSLSSGGYLGEQSVTISSSTDGATIHYTNNGNQPDETSPVYSGAITIPVNTTLTLRAIAVKDGLLDSSTTTATYATIDIATWNQTAGGSWGTVENWLASVLPVGGPVKFDALTLTGDTTVTLDGNRSASSLVFGDVGNSSQWLLGSGSGGTLTLAGSGTPALAVTGQATTISAPIAGTQGVAKEGSGTLVLAGNNSYTGGTTVNGGNLILRAGAFETGIVKGSVTVNPGATLQVDYAGNFFPLKSTDTVNVNGGGTLDLAGATGGENAASSYVAAVNLSSANGTAAAVTSSDDVSPLRFGRQSNGLITSTGPVANTYGAPIALLSGNSTTMTITAASGNTLEFSSGISDFPGYGGLPVTFDGAGTTRLDGSNNYAGATAVQNGSLIVDGSTGTGAMTVQAGATLSGIGQVGGSTTVNGTLTPAGTALNLMTINNLAIGSTGKVVCQIDKSGATLTHDQVFLNNGVTYGGTLEVTATGDALAAGDSFWLFDAAAYSGTFTQFTLPSLPAGLKWDTSSLTTDGTIAVAVAGTYDTWASDQNLTAANNGKSDDPDGDGVTNLMEYALGGDPLGSTNNGVCTAAIRDVSGTPALTLTLAVRTGAVFAPGANNTRTGTIDGIVYRIEGSTDLASWTSTITEVTPALVSGLPTVPAGYQYHTFRTAGPVSSTAREFVRAFVSEIP